jgi:hypothetical protein
MFNFLADDHFKARFHVLSRLQKAVLAVAREARLGGSKTGRTDNGLIESHRAVARQALR